MPADAAAWPPFLSAPRPSGADLADLIWSIWLSLAPAADLEGSSPPPVLSTFGQAVILGAVLTYDEIFGVEGRWLLLTTTWSYSM